MTTINYVDVATVFLFMVTMIGGSIYGAGVYARWQNRETKMEIERRFKEFRQRIRETA